MGWRQRLQSHVREDAVAGICGVGDLAKDEGKRECESGDERGQWATAAESIHKWKNLPRTVAAQTPLFERHR